MKEYVLTVFSPAGEKLLDEAFQAEHDEAGMQIATHMLHEEGYSEHAHRCVTADARLILFHS